MAEGLAKLFRNNVWKLHKLLESVISDKGPQFAVGLTKELNKMLGIETKLSMAYHLQMDGQTERTNQELEQYLKMYVNYRQNNWSEQLVTAKFAKEMKERHKEARAALVRSQEEMKRQADRSRKEAEEYRVEDRVLISTKDFLMELMKRVMKKLMEKFIGPYMVKKIVSENMVELKLLASLRIYPVVNVRRIVKYKEQVEGQKKIPPPPVEVASKKEYKVEDILDRQERRGKMRYLVKWKGYTVEENIWKGLENLKNAMEKVE